MENNLKEHQQNKSLTSAELGELFANYLGDTLYICVFKHQLEVVEDAQIKENIERALQISEGHIQFLRELFEKENIPIPVGFGDQDVRLDAPKLYSDMFMLFYIMEMSRAVLTTYSGGLSSSSREDILEYFENCIHESTEQYKQTLHLLLEKGMDVTFPEVPYPSKVDFVEKDSFTSFIAGKKRPLTAIEIKHLQVNINTNTLGKALMLGFSQVASSEKIRDYCQDGVQLAEKQINQLGEMLMKENLPTPMLLDTHITDSTVSPFSDKLILYHTFIANGIGIQNYGLAISKVLRHDIHSQFATLSAGIAKYSNKGLNMMIENGWLEEPPTCADREKLAKYSPGFK
ncbi:DUF3231 family protein [Aquisalibacillus elongatus]|uniref:Uncharacterized protein DUF3231 n=1 Tax=Aquisalibacillus elongatus TaxID=485577 RepID=A0A3N5BL02_9BACI|nr:DUF3231 family protein [Aquisalibacillus elongatus]RPF55860.1 uncharacterized protein DUF3231 [Aquisalibacillus elongatus]